MMLYFKNQCRIPLSDKVVVAFHCAVCNARVDFSWWWSCQLEERTLWKHQGNSIQRFFSFILVRRLSIKFIKMKVPFLVCRRESSQQGDLFQVRWSFKILKLSRSWKNWGKKPRNTNFSPWYNCCIDQLGVDRDLCNFWEKTLILELQIRELD